MAKANKRSALVANSRGLGQILDGLRTFHIPYNQRPWSWRKKQIMDLWEDAEMAFKRNVRADGASLVMTTEADLRKHFMGALVLAKSPGALEVVDGQQRLTALSLFINAIWKVAAILPADGDDKRARLTVIRRSHACLFRTGGTGSAPLLNLDTVYSDVYQKCVIEAETEPEFTAAVAALLPEVRESKPIQHFLESYRLILETVRSFATSHSVTARMAALNHLLTVLLEHFVLVEIVVEDFGCSFQVFKSLNARGLPLSCPDNIKNELFIKASPTDHAEIKRTWDEMCRSLPRSDVHQFLWFRHLAFVGPCAKAQLYDEAKRAEMDSWSSAEVLQKLQRWKEQADTMASISLVKGGCYESATEDMLREFETLGITYGWIFCLAAASVFKGDEDRLRKAIRMSVDFCFREITVRQRDTTEVERVLSLAARQLIKEKDLAVPLKMLRDNSSDREFQAEMETFAISAPKKQFYILYKMEKHLFKHADITGIIPAWHSNDANNVEHIMPRILPTAANRQAEWGWARGDEARRKLFIHRLGNLCLLEATINSDVSSYDFTAKVTGAYSGSAALKKGQPRKSYNDSRLKMPEQIRRNFGSWSYQQIEARQKDLATLALKVWKL